IVDAGTIEHVFDMRMVMANIVNLLAVGGTAFHVAPLSNWINHGFYQLSPCLFYDTYAANGFDDFEAYRVHFTPGPAVPPVTILPYEHSTQILEPEDRSQRELFVFVARKTASLVPFRIPTQSFYSRDRSPKLQVRAS